MSTAEMTMAAETGSSSDGNGERRRAEEQKGDEGMSVKGPACFPALPYLWTEGCEWDQAMHPVTLGIRVTSPLLSLFSLVNCTLPKRRRKRAIRVWVLLGVGVRR